MKTLVIVLDVAFVMSAAAMADQSSDDVTILAKKLSPSREAQKAGRRRFAVCRRHVWLR